MQHDMLLMGEIMRHAREAKGLTQAALAEMIDVSVRTVIAIEKDQRNPSCDVFNRLIHALDVSADTFFYPNSRAYTPEQDQFIREFLACDEKEQRLIRVTVQHLLQELRDNSG